jgi:mRNA interferase RelE/StbE
MYKLIITKKAKKDLEKIDRSKREIIVAWIDNNLANTNDPRAKGKPLTGDHRNEWRYRIGQYRILAEINDDTITIMVVRIRHRKEAYRR